MARSVMFVVTFGLTIWISSNVVRSSEQEDKALLSAMNDAKVSLQQGLIASQREGRPISARFEVEDGKLQLSVYTTKDGKYSEVIVDYTTGAAAKSELITEGEDLAHAKPQTEAMSTAKIDLKGVVDRAAIEVTGSRPISIVPEKKDGHSAASVVVLKQGQFETISQH